MSDLSSQIQAALEFPVTVKINDMTWAGCGIGVEVYSNGDPGHTVLTRHKESDGIEAIVAAHLAARAPTAQKKSRQTARKVHREIFG